MFLLMTICPSKLDTAVCAWCGGFGQVECMIDHEGRSETQNCAKCNGWGHAPLAPPTYAYVNSKEALAAAIAAFESAAGVV